MVIKNFFKDIYFTILGFIMLGGDTIKWIFSIMKKRGSVKKHHKKFVWKKGHIELLSVISTTTIFFYVWSISHVAYGLLAFVIILVVSLVLSNFYHFWVVWKNVILLTIPLSMAVFVVLMLATGEEIQTPIGKTFTASAMINNVGDIPILYNNKDYNVGVDKKMENQEVYVYLVDHTNFFNLPMTSLTLKSEKMKKAFEEVQNTAKYAPLTPLKEGE